MTKPTIIITGGDGFIGRTIITSFHKEFNFIVLKRKGSEIHFPEIKEHAQICYDLSSIKSLVNEYSEIFGLIMLGASRPVTLAAKEIKDISELEIEQAKKVLDFCVEKKIEKVLFASSKSVYGKNDLNPFSEDNEPFPNSLYGVNKLLIEKLGMYYAEKHEIEFTSLRLAQVFGYGERQINMPQVLMKNALSNNNLELRKGVENDKRAYIYVKDAASAFIYFLQNQLNGIFNIGMEKSYTPVDFAELIIQNTPTATTIVYKHTNNVAIRNEILSVEKAKTFAKWECQWDLQTALADFWKESENFRKTD